MSPAQASSSFWIGMINKARGIIPITPPLVQKTTANNCGRKRADSRLRRAVIVLGIDTPSAYISNMKVIVSFSLESELYAGIEQIAVREGRTRSSTAAHLLRAGLAARQAQSAPTEPADASASAT